MIRSPSRPRTRPPWKVTHARKLVLEILEGKTLPATHFVLSGLAASALAGSTDNVSITAANADGSTDTAYAGTVHFSSSDPNAVLPADTTLSGGTGTFPVQLQTAELQTLAATTGILQGTPALGAGGVYLLHFKAQDSAGDALQTNSLIVNEAPTITSVDHATFTVGGLNYFVVTTSHSFPAHTTLTMSGYLPAGSWTGFYDYGNGVGVIAGAPSAMALGTWPMTLTAHNGVGPDTTQQFRLTIQQVTLPRVVRVERFGIHDQPTLIVLTFNEPLEQGRARSLANYQLFQVGHRQPIPLVSATYDPATWSVTLRPVRPLPLNLRYVLNVVGTPPHGLADTHGQFLDGTGAGKPGTNFTTIVTSSNLRFGQPGPLAVQAVPTGPAAVWKSARAIR